MAPAAETDAAAGAVLLARGWLERGRYGAAREHAAAALAIRSGQPEAHRVLAHALIGEGAFAEALAELRRALLLRPDDAALQREAAVLAELAGEPAPAVPLPDNPAGKLRFRSLYDGAHQRSGWAYALSALHPLHSRSGVLFEPFLEDPFAWQHPRNGLRPAPELLEAIRRPSYASRVSSEERRIVPFREPWVGVLHNPQHMPEWFHREESPQAVFAKPVWRQSLESCIGLFTLSRNLGEWLAEATQKPVSALLHPSEIPQQCFSMDRFLVNPRKHIIQVGWWLRVLGGIHRLPMPADNPLGYRKLRLVPRFFPGAPDYLRGLMERERVALGWQPMADEGGVTAVEHVPNDVYDRLLSENLVFLWLHDASANNTVVECIARATPLLVNPLPAVVEYLGADYPLYFNDLGQAARQALDLGRIRAAHEYLRACDTRAELGADVFRRSFEDSEVYRLL